VPQDAFAMRVAASELDTLLRGGKINKITQPTADEVIFSIYSNGRTVNLTACANAQCARLCPTRLEKKNPDVAPNFCMLLRKHLVGASISRVENYGFERITAVVFEGRNDFRESVEKTLICEIMGKYSNLILTENGKILGTLRPTFGDISAERTLFTGSVYTLPPAQDKIEITEKTRVLEAFCKFGGGDAVSFTATVIKGISLPTAREAVVKFFGKTEIPALLGKAEEYYDFLLRFLCSPDIRPNVWPADSPKDFYPTDYQTVSGDKKYFPTLLDAEAYHFDRIEADRTHRQRSKAISDKLKNHEKKLRKKLQMLYEKELSCEDAEQNRIKGELLTAYQYAVPAGAAVCELVNYYSETGETVKIKLDPDLSANKNAQVYYKKYSKQKKTLAAVQPQKQETLAELDYLSDIFSELERCSTSTDFDFVTEELKAIGLIREQAQKKKNQKPSRPKTFEKDGFLIKVGRNNLQNDEVTFSAARDDLWLHTKDFHSAHVIIESEGRPIPDEVLLLAAEICAYNSKARNGDKVPVDYCRKRFVKKPPKAKPGGVIYTDFKTILVTPHPHDEAERR